MCTYKYFAKSASAYFTHKKDVHINISQKKCTYKYFTEKVYIYIFHRKVFMYSHPDGRNDEQYIHNCTHEHEQQRGDDSPFNVH